MKIEKIWKFPQNDSSNQGHKRKRAPTLEGIYKYSQGEEHKGKKFLAT